MNERIVIHPPKKDDSGKFYVTVSYYIDGNRKQKRKSGFDRSKDAKLAGEQIKKKLEQDMPVIKRVGLSMPTFNEFAETYCGIMKKSWSQNTMKNRKQALKHCDFKNKLLNDISKMDLSLNVTRLETIYSYNTISSIKSGWSVFLNAAKEYGYLQNVPTHSMKKPTKKTDELENVLSVEVATTLVESIDDEELKLYTLIGYTCGPRAGEATDMNINDIDFKTGIWKIRHQFQYDGKSYCSTDRLKTKNSYRDVPIPSKTIAAIKAYPFRTIDGFIFHRAPTYLTVKANKTYKKLGAPITYHGLRHTYITNLIRSKKFDIQSVAKLAGDTVETILETYSHYLEEMQEENIVKINSLFG